MLKILFYSIILLSVVVIIGIWESFVEPIVTILTQSIEFV